VERQAHGIVGGGTVARRCQRLVVFGRALQGAAVVAAHAGIVEFVRHVGTEAGGQRLPLDREHAVAL